MTDGGPPSVLVTTSTLPVRADDGVPRFVLDLAQGLTAHANVTVLAPGANGAKSSERLGQLQVERFTYWLPRAQQRLALGQGMRDNLRASWLAKLQVLPFLVRQALATRRLIRDRRVDVVNAHWLVPQGVTSAWACGRKRASLVLHVHAGDVYLLRKVPFGRQIARYVVDRASAVLADGSHVRDSLDALLGYESGAELRPMGVDTAVFGPDAHPPKRAPGEDPTTDFPTGFLLFFGRFSEKKGVIYLVRALPHILAQRPGVGLLLIGDGTERRNIEQEVERLGVADSVRFLGRQTHGTIAEYLSRCAVAVVPSIIDSRGETEGMPTVVLEALAAGARVVGSAVDGIPDVLRHAENGWLCREKDPEDLAEKILLAMQNPNHSSVATAALATAASHDWAQVATHYASHLQVGHARFQETRTTS